MRQLHVYLIIDSSESMIGSPMESINKGIANMMLGLRRNPYALETVCLCVITFDSIARVLVPLTEITDFVIPVIKVKPGTSLGLALELLIKQIQTNTKKTTADQKGDYRPLVFLLTDGQPTDDYSKALEKLKKISPKPANIYGIGCGNEVDFSVLSDISDITFHLDEMSPDKFAKFFIWMSASVQSASQSTDGKVSLEKSVLPDGFTIVNKDDLPPCPPLPLQVFIHSRCSRTKKLYMMRYVFHNEYQGYVPESSYPLPDDFFTEGTYSPSISSDALLGVAPCPYCGNTSWGQCGNCSTGFCLPENPPKAINCPSCHQQLLADENASSFDITRSSG